MNVERQILGDVPLGVSQPPDSFARLDAKVRCLLKTYMASELGSDWRKFLENLGGGFAADHYVRHLVKESANLELVLICWGPGQNSAAHNHARSHCWLTVLDGAVEELRYHMPDVRALNAPAFTAPLIPAGSETVHPGETTYINDDISPMHAVHCKERCAAGAVSLHVYCPPIRS
jgi:cysteine dioxygenase